MRGEPNAIGVATKWKPSMSPDSYFYDHQIEEVERILELDLIPVWSQLSLGKTVVWPEDGIGTGLSRLPEKAPRIWASLELARKQLETL